MARGTVDVVTLLAALASSPYRAGPTASGNVLANSPSDQSAIEMVVVTQLAAGDRAGYRQPHGSSIVKQRRLGLGRYFGWKSMSGTG